MPPRLAIRPTLGRGMSTIRAYSKLPQPVCFLCSLSRHSLSVSRRPRRGTSYSYQRRAESTVASAESTQPASNARKELEKALTELQKHATSYVNLSRLQLALRGLRQPPGRESVRVAVLGLANGSSADRSANELLRLLLADPLNPKDEWESEVEQHDARKPLIVRVGAGQKEQEVQPAYAKGNLLKEIHVSSPSLDGNGLEVLLMETVPFVGSDRQPSVDEAALVPIVDIPASESGRVTPITTPVHKAIVLVDGIAGIPALASLALPDFEETIAAVVNLKGYRLEEGTQGPYTFVDIKEAKKGLELFRKETSNAMDYEHLWYQSNMPALSNWLKEGALSSSDGKTKEAVKALIRSVLQNTLSAVTTEEGKHLSRALRSGTSSSALPGLNRSLEAWAEAAHTELQEQLDLAFDGRRWRKLGWWKLFWRVDDVGVLSSEMLAQRFLPTAERELIYLAGRIEEAGLFASEPSGSPSYSGPELLPAPGPAEKGKPGPGPGRGPASLRWPTHISFTRRYLQEETIPALQALAQKLVLQEASASTMSVAVGVLVYFSSTGYNAGAVAALGVVWSLRRLQRQWETARAFWEGEVREEGRKAVRGVEASVAGALDRAQEKGGLQGQREGMSDARRVSEIVERAREALGRLE